MYIVVIQSLSRVWLFETPWTAAYQPLSILHYLLEFAQIHTHQIYDAIQPSHPLLPPSLMPSIFPSIRVFSNESALPIRWPEYWSFSFSMSPSNDSGLVSFRINRFDHLAVQGTLKSLLQHHNSQVSIHCCPLLLLASVFSSTRVFSNEFSLYIRCPKYWSFSNST